MNDDYDSNFETNDREDDGTTYESYKGKRGGPRSGVFAAINVVLNERTVIPVTRPPVDGNTRLFTYAVYPLIGVILGLVMIVWVNIARLIPMSIYLTALIGLVLIYTLQVGLPLIGFGQTADALFSQRRMPDKMRILMARVLRPSAVVTSRLFAAVELTAFYYLFLFFRFGLWRLLFAMLAVFVFARAIGSLLTLSLAPLEPEEDGDMKTLKLVQLILMITAGVAAVGLILTGVWAALVSLAVMIGISVLCHSYFRAKYHGITRKMSVFMVAAAEVIGLLALLLPLGSFLW